jgi:hypothetical protein
MGVVPMVAGVAAIVAGDGDLANNLDGNLGMRLGF